MLALLLTVSLAQAPPNPCGVIVAGESAVMPFFEQTLAAGHMEGRYSAAVVQATAGPRARLVQWETRCDATAQRFAVQDLRKLTSRFRTGPDRLYIDALLAVAVSRGPEIRAPHSRGGLFITARRSSNAEREARRLFDRVLPQWPAAALLREYATLALATRDPSTLDSAAAALRDHAPRAADAAVVGPRDPTGRDLDSAAVAGDRDTHHLDELRALHAMTLLARHDTARAAALAHAASPRSVRARRLAGIVLMIADSASAVGSRLYLEALAAADTADIALFYEDLWPLLEEESERDWDKLAHAERARWLREEWEWRASRASRTLADRLRIHFQRAQHAIDRYPRMSFRGAPDPAALVIAHAPGTPFDDRGLLYLRHGEPDVLEIISLAAQVWYYQHLDARRRDGIFTLMKVSTRVDWASVDRACAARQMTPALMESCVRSRRATETALHTEDATPEFTRLLPASLVTYAFRDAHGGTELLAYAALRAGSVTPREETDGVSYRLTATLAVEHPRTRQVERRDTVLELRLAAHPAPEQALRVGMSVPASADALAQVRVTVLNAAREGEGQVLLTRRSVPAFAPGQLALSDIVLAEPRDGGTLQRGRHLLAPLPGHDITQGATFRVFHETYGVTQETPASVRITVAPVVDDNMWGRLRGLVSQRQALDLQFDDVLEPEPNGVSYLTRDVTAQLEPGRYTLRVEVRTAASNAIRTTEVTIVGR